MTKLLGALALVAILLGSVQLAEARRNDNSRIRQGVKSGELTTLEAAKLRAQQVHQAKMRQQYNSDGVLTSWERNELRKMENRQDSNIYHQKHDGQDRN